MRYKNMFPILFYFICSRSAAIRFHVSFSFSFILRRKFLFIFIFFFLFFLFLNFYFCKNLLKVIHQWYQHNENEIKNFTGLTRPSNSNNISNSNNKSNRNRYQNAAPVAAAMEATIAMEPMAVMEANHHSFLHAKLVFIHMNCQR